MKGKIRDVDVFFYPPGGRNFFLILHYHFICLFVTMHHTTAENSIKTSGNIEMAKT